jgi:hypothetical protein
MSSIASFWHGNFLVRAASNSDEEPGMGLMTGGRRERRTEASVTPVIGVLRVSIIIL